MFKIGMRVVCIDASNQKLGGLFQGCVYKINDIHPDGDALRLDGLSFWHYSYRFRPVQDQYTEEEIEAVDISELEKIEFETIEI